MWRCPHQLCPKRTWTETCPQIGVRALLTERARAEAKLANPAFLEKAPAPVVAKARERLAEVDQALAKVRAQQVELSGAR